LNTIFQYSHPRISKEQSNSQGMRFGIFIPA
jgi:hypothetical protein